VTISAHKFNGLKGSGALILKERQKLAEQIHGGGQEMGFRSGTGDVPRAAALAKALRLTLKDIDKKFTSASELKDRLKSQLLEIDGIYINSPESGSPYILNCSVDRIRPETLLHALAQKEIYISTVSACSSKKTEPSKIILAMTNNEKRASSSVRFSISSDTTSEEIDSTISVIKEVLFRLR
jgi:cysteine desulfurase